MRSTTTVVFGAIDALISPANRALTGFPEFLEGLNEAEIPFVPVTARSRLQLDATLRKFDLGHPFLGEAGCGVFLPEDYFHLKPARTIRLARFTCIPVAAAQPAAAELLDELSEETRVEVVSLRGLSPRELSQNVGLPQREAELMRLRDFDELFFFAGAGENEIETFRTAAVRRRAQVRQRGTLWSLAIGANLGQCVRELAQLYQRSFRAAPWKVALATPEDAGELFPACDRAILLTDRENAEAPAGKAKVLPLFGPDTWEETLEAIRNRQL